jgi:hypothetical protein
MYVLFFVIIKEVKIIKILLHTYVPHANYVSEVGYVFLTSSI